MPLGDLEYTNVLHRLSTFPSLIDTQINFTYIHVLSCSYFYLLDTNTLECMTCLGEVISEAYVLEYGTDCLEMHVGAVHPGERVLVIDDIVATGGTLSAAIRLLGKVMWFSSNLILITLSLPISIDF